jgi:hypothetical protein
MYGTNNSIVVGRVRKVDYALRDSMLLFEEFKRRLMCLLNTYLLPIRSLRYASQDRGDAVQLLMRIVDLRKQKSDARLDKKAWKSSPVSAVCLQLVWACPLALRSPAYMKYSIRVLRHIRNLIPSSRPSRGGSSAKQTPASASR